MSKTPLSCIRCVVATLSPGLSKRGDSYVTEMEVAYVFTSARRAESGMDDIQDAVYESDADIDLEKIEVNEDIVTIEITIHH